MSIEFDQGKAYTVDRGAPKARNGQGMLAGMGVVFKHFRDAMTKKLDNPSEISGVFTVQYPEERYKLPEAARNFPILLYEDASGQELCTSCFQCERICPPQVIHITQAKDPVSGKAVPAIAEFLIEYDACMSCGLCAEVCPFDAIKMDHEYELSTDVHGGLTIDRAGLMRPISYYEQLAPSFWAEVKDGALKKLQGAIKRRSGLVGIAPQMVEVLKKREPSIQESGVGSQNTAIQNPEPRTEPIELRTQNPEPPSPPTPLPVGEERRSRGEGIAATTEAATPVPTAPASSITDTTAPATAPAIPAPSGDARAEKAAKLVAIRAANAKKNETPEGTP
ncbi:MAG: 4Fe-4S binding protein [Roseiflexaceae bacterium]|nr:4Fe-4S binding protein [Roseiflexaceae bacterium]